MRTRMKIMGLAALPLAGLLATGGAALAQTAGTSASTQVVQQAAVRAADPCPDHVVKAVQRTAAPCPQHAVKAVQRTAKPCPQHAVKVAVQPVQQQQQVRDRDCRDHKAPQPAGTVTRTAAHTHHGDACDHADR